MANMNIKCMVPKCLSVSMSRFYILFNITITRFGIYPNEMIMNLYIISPTWMSSVLKNKIN